MAIYNEPDRAFALLKDLSVALDRLTILRIPETELTEEPRAGSSVWAYPVIGAVLGAVGGIVYAIASGVGLPPVLAGILAIATLISVTAARNETALAAASERLGIIFAASDSRLSEFGERLATPSMLALVLAVTARIGAVAAIGDPGTVTAALVAAMAFSLAALVVASYFARDLETEPGSQGEPLGAPGAGVVLWAAAIAVVISAIVLPFGIAASIIAAAVCGIGLAYVAKHGDRLGSKEVIGTVQPVTEIVVLLVIAASAG